MEETTYAKQNEIKINKKPLMTIRMKRTFFLWEWIFICRKHHIYKQSEMKKRWPLMATCMEGNLFYESKCLYVEKSTHEK